MGRKGKGLNPADLQRRQDRKKALDRNKKTRRDAREAALRAASAAELARQLVHLERLERRDALDGAGKKKLALVKKYLYKAAKREREHAPSKSVNSDSDEDGGQRVPLVESKIREDEASSDSEMTDPDMSDTQVRAAVLPPRMMPSLMVEPPGLSRPPGLPPAVAPWVRPLPMAAVRPPGAPLDFPPPPMLAFAYPPGHLGPVPMGRMPMVPPQPRVPLPFPPQRPFMPNMHAGGRPIMLPRMPRPPTIPSTGRPMVPGMAPFGPVPVPPPLSGRGVVAPPSTVRSAPPSAPLQATPQHATPPQQTPSSSQQTGPQPSAEEPAAASRVPESASAPADATPARESESTPRLLSRVAPHASHKLVPTAVRLNKRTAPVLTQQQILARARAKRAQIMKQNPSRRTNLPAPPAAAPTRVSGGHVLGLAGAGVVGRKRGRAEVPSGSTGSASVGMEDEVARLMREVEDMGGAD